jgi:poly(A) polymerase
MTNMMNTAIKIINKLKSHNHTAVIAGGAVRDLLLGLDPKDIDIATSATPDTVEKLFKHTIPVGKQFGIIVVIENGIEFEIATFRQDSKSGDGRRPDSVSFSSMEEDAKRRDLTINGLFLDPTTDKVFDFVGGREDIEHGLISFIGNAEERIEEDRLRILRAVRFAARLNFDMDDEARKAIKNNAHRIHDVSVERIKSEIDKMMKASKPSVAFEMMREFGLLKHIMPEVDAMWGQKQGPKWHSEGNLETHVMMVLDATRKKTSEIPTLWAALLHDVGKPTTAVLKEDGINHSFHGHDKVGAEMAEEIMKRFKSSNREIDTVVGVIADHMKSGIARDMKKSTLRKFIAQPHFEQLMHVFEADCESSIPADPDRADGKMDGVVFLKEKKEEVGEVKELPKPFITGRHLIEMGMKPGPEFKSILDRMMDKQLEGKFETVDEALEALRREV